MGDEDKIRNAAEEAGGKIKEKAGELTGNEELEAQGVEDQASANVKQAGEHLKDAADEAGDAVDDALNR
jgi:uncharacterized protein YjbJ (UPF0337 family)